MAIERDGDGKVHRYGAQRQEDIGSSLGSAALRTPELSARILRSVRALAACKHEDPFDVRDDLGGQMQWCGSCGATRARTARQMTWGPWVLSAQVLALVEAWNGKKP